MRAWSIEIEGRSSGVSLLILRLISPRWFLMMQQPYTISPDMHEMVETASPTNCLQWTPVTGVGHSLTQKESADLLQRRKSYRVPLHFVN
jgi:hypothetical protein